MQQVALQCEQARALRERALRNLPGAVILFVVVWGMLASIVPPPRLYLWAAAIALLLAGRSVYWFLQGVPSTEAAARRMLRASECFALLAGLLSGTGMLLAQPYLQPSHQLFLFCTMVGLAIQSMFALSTHFPSFFLQITPMACAVVYLQMAMPEVASHGITTLTALMAAFLLLGSYRLGRLARASMRSRLISQGLVQELQSQKETAQSLASSRSRFLTAASHDLRQPMHSLDMFLGAMRSQPWDSEAARAMLAEAQDCARNMDYQFRNLLDLAKLDAGTVPVEPEVFAIELLLDRLRCEFQPQAMQRSMPLYIPASGAVVYSDPALVERLLRYLLSNALQHAEYGVVKIVCQPADGRLRLTVRDNGVGVAAHVRELMFEEFSQVRHAALEGRRSLGLGLALARRTAALLGTKITMETEAGKGTCFHFDLPLEAKVAADGIPQRPIHFASLQVLVVDDMPLVLDATACAVEAWECSLVRATSSAEAIRCLAANTRAPDLIITDYQLLGETGVDLIQIVQDEFNQAIPAIIVTAREDLRDVLDSGHPVLRKPVRTEELRAVAEKLLGGILTV